MPERMSLPLMNDVTSDRTSGSTDILKLAVGSTLDNGWTLESVTPQNATFSHQGQTRELRLPLLRLPPPSKVPPITLPNVPTP